MSFLEDLGDTLDRGAEAAARTGKSLKLKAQIADAQTRREGACMRLGAELYPQLKEDDLSQEAKNLVREIGRIDESIEEWQAELDKVDAEAKAAQRSYWVAVCPKCGYRMSEGDAFCSRCGAKMPKPGPEAPAGAREASEDAPKQDESVIDVEPVEEPRPSVKKGTAE